MMDLSKIKDLINRNGDKFILVENDKPEIVILSFREYEKLTVGHPEQSEAPMPQQVVAQGEGSLWIQKPKPVIVAESPVINGVETDRPEETEFVIPLGPAETGSRVSLHHPPEPCQAKPVRLEDISLEDLPL